MTNSFASELIYALANPASQLFIPSEELSVK